MDRLRPYGRWFDALIAASLAVFGQVEAWTGPWGAPRLLVAVTMMIGPLALVFRRRAPMTVVVVVFGSFVVMSLLEMDLSEAFAPVLAGLVAIGSAGYYARHSVAALVVAIGLVWSTVIIIDGLAIADLLWQALLIGLGWSVGRGAAVGALRAQLSEQRAAAAVAEERVRIARELHDIVAHSISVMTLHAGGVRRLLHPDQRDERDSLQVIEQSGRQATADLQRVLDVLRSPTDQPPEPNLGLAGIEELLHTARAAGLTTRLRVAGSPRPLPAGLDLSAYRIMQEALTNVLKHADATRVEATVCYTDTAIRLDLVDDGARRNPVHVGGHGLIGMRERTALYGGTLDAGPLPDHGFRVAAVIPVPEAPS
ncbi:MAG TPA: histidine kinase [Actinophytocola sp.]|jgi:signal transduction histidine kinase|uniref:sensor histidine kinase n=1 Tax=Actinophytocola sp. TaxID=1872138 RepID=UPI002F92C94A